MICYLYLDKRDVSFYINHYGNSFFFHPVRVGHRNAGTAAPYWCAILTNHRILFVLTVPQREWLSFEMRPTIKATGLTTWLMTLPLLAVGHRYITRERTFYKVDGKSLIGSVTAVMEVKDSFDCSYLCMQYGPVACLSFNLERSNNSIHTCELSSSEKYLEPEKVQERTGYDYYGIEYDVGRPILPN